MGCCKSVGSSDPFLEVFSRLPYLCWCAPQSTEEIASWGLNHAPTKDSKTTISLALGYDPPSVIGFDSSVVMPTEGLADHKARVRRLFSNIDFNLLDADDKDSEDGDETEEVVAVPELIQDIFTAGSDSSAATVEWALAELINHPHMLRKLREEIDKVVGKDRVVQECDIPNLPYLQAVVKETLRLHPAAPLATRVSDKEVKVGGYKIPANTSLFVNVWSIGRDPNYWKDPLEFRPERFTAAGEDGLGSIDFRGQHFELVPFGSGRRVCPGISLALQVIQLTLAALVQCFHWKVGGKEEEMSGGLDMKEGIGMVILRAQPLVCVPVARLDPFPLLDP
uniref:Cytochrome P450 93A2 n=1 Tax=Elaeis guineensis var. tenera TaxID=51953 RepID=A0A6I9R0L3_ELAGV|nr:cytochrome P450 93A2 [Elaeis guineensis]